MFINVAFILKAIYFKVNNAGIHFAGIFILKIRFENYNIYIKWLVDNRISTKLTFVS